MRMFSPRAIHWGRPAIHPAEVGWGVLAGAGASLLGMKLAGAVLFTLYSETAVARKWYGPLPAEWTQLIGMALGVGVAMLASGWRGVALLLAVDASVLGPFLVRQVVSPFCPEGVLCLPSQPAQVVFANWPFAAGILIGAASGDLIARRGGGASNPMLESAGAYAVMTWSLLTAMAFLLPASADLAYTELGLAGLAGLSAAVLVAVSRSTRPIRDAALISISLFVAPIPGMIEQIKQWIYFGRIDTTVTNPGALAMLSALLLVPLTALCTWVLIDPHAEGVELLQKGGRA